MLIKPLSNAEVKNAKVTGKDYSLHDGFGLLLYVSKVGGRTWRFRYQHPSTKKRQTLTIGRYPEFTLAEARDERDKARRLVARGIDPNESRRDKKAEREKRKNQSFKVFALDWIKLMQSDNKRLNTMKSIIRTVNVYLIPIIGDISIHDIKASNVIAAVRVYEDRPAILDQVIMRARAIMDYAVNCGAVDTNPIARINKAFPSMQSEPVKALSIDRLPEFLTVWEAAPVHPSTKYGLLFQMLTMVRPREALCAQWDEIDLVNKVWTVPATRMKGKREHAVPLSDQAISIINEMSKIKKGAYIFYGAYRHEKPISGEAVLAALKRHGLSDEMTPHGFRSMWSTTLNEEGFNPDIIEAALAHKSGNAIRDIYNRTTYFEQREKMMAWIGELTDSARLGVINRSSGNKGLRVVNL